MDKAEYEEITKVCNLVIGCSEQAGLDFKETIQRLQQAITDYAFDGTMPTMKEFFGK